MPKIRTILVLTAAAALIPVGCSRVDIGWSSGRTASVKPGPPSRGKGPPAWAPAHGYRRKMAYYYYPDHEVYFSLETKQYSWREGVQWRVGVTLPSSLNIDIVFDRHHRIEVAGEGPHVFHAQVAAQYPRNGNGNGKARGNGKGLGKGRGKGRGKGKGGGKGRGGGRR